MRFTGRGILLDIEGTTSSVRFVYDVMFPFVRRELAGYLAEHADDEALAFVADQIARERGEESFDSWTRSAAATNSAAQRNLLEQEVLRLMDGDVKSTGLKQLQGMIWRRGFESGELRAHVYDDVPAALAAWNKRGLDVRIYSSGSVAAQKLFFGHTEVGDLLGHFRGHYDTTSGGKKEADSYRRIAAASGLAPAEMLFLSDIAAELDAARTAGMQTALLLRPGNAPVADGHGHAELRSFAEIEGG